MITCTATLRAGRDPSQRKTQTGSIVATVTGAHTDKRSQQENTTWLVVKCYGKTAENIHRLVAKGTLFAVTGRLEAARWEQDGQPRERLELHADRIEPITWPNFQRLPGEETPATAETQTPTPPKPADLSDDEPPF